MTHRSVALFALPLALTFAACSFQTLEVDDCTSSASCRATFGQGSVCLTSGYCTEPTPCTTNDGCETEFGMGSVCTIERTCSAPATVACSDDALCEGTYGLGSTCVDGSSCSRPPITACTQNTECEAAFGDDAVCGSDGVCRRSSSCRGNDAVCEAELGQGAFCDENDVCRPAPASCDGDDAFCVDQLGDDDAFCDDDDVCRIRVEQECADDATCVSERGLGSVCDDGTCSEPVLCAQASECVEAFGFGHRCEAGVCRLPAVTGCTSNDACRTTYGWGSTCTAETGLCAEAAPALQCRITEPTDFWNRPEAYRDRVVFGALMSFSNNAVEKNAIELAIRQINTQNVVGGRQFAVVFCDYGTGNDSVTVNLATFLARDVGVSVILGGFTSSATQAAFQAVSNLDDADAVFLSPSATSPALFEVDNVRPTDDDPGRVWSLVPTANAQTALLAARMKEDFPDALRLRFLIESFPGSTEIEALLIDELEGLYDAGQFTTVRSPFERTNTAQLEAAVDGALATDPDAIIVISALSTTLQRVLSRASDVAGFADRSIYVTDTGHDVLLLRIQSEISNEILDAVTGVRPAPGRGGPFNRFASQYLSVFSNPPTTAAYSAHAYDAAWLGALGATWSLLQEDGLSALGVARGLRRISSTDPDARTVDFSIETQYLTARNVFTDGGQIRVTGASGPIAFDNTTEQILGGVIELWEVDTACTEGAVDGRCFLEISRTEL